MDAPEYLYHGSGNRGIQIFEPKAEKVRDKDEGPVVFATQDKAFASMFLAPGDDSWTHKSRINGRYYHVISDRERYLREDKGGKIYTLPSQTFETVPNTGMGKYEWVSKAPVKPMLTEAFESGLEAQKKLGVQVCFVGEDEFRRLQENLQAEKIPEAIEMMKNFKVE